MKISFFSVSTVLVAFHGMTADAVNLMSYQESPSSMLAFEEGISYMSYAQSDSQAK